MSYNIDRFKIKRMENLKIPLSAFYIHERKDWHPEKEYNEDGKLIISSGFGQQITGTLENDILLVEMIEEMYGEGSGTFMSWIFETAIKQSTGILEAVCVWEGGDTINRLIVNDGKVEWEDIEL